MTDSTNNPVYKAWRRFVINHAHDPDEVVREILSAQLALVELVKEQKGRMVGPRGPKEDGE